MVKVLKGNSIHSHSPLYSNFSAGDDVKLRTTGFRIKVKHNVKSFKK